MTHRRHKPGKLRVIHTARTLEAINQAVAEGFRALVKPVATNPPFKHYFMVHQHMITGEVRVERNRENMLFEEILQKANLTVTSSEWKLIIPPQAYHPPRYENPFAAYLVPPDIRIGEQVWLDDLIEDLDDTVGKTHRRLDAWAAIWNGEDLEIDYDPKLDRLFTMG